MGRRSGEFLLYRRSDGSHPTSESDSADIPQRGDVPSFLGSFTQEGIA
jgi:hypothetical protein